MLPLPAVFFVINVKNKPQNGDTVKITLKREPSAASMFWSLSAKIFIIRIWKNFIARSDKFNVKLIPIKYSRRSGFAFLFHRRNALYRLGILSLSFYGHDFSKYSKIFIALTRIKFAFKKQLVGRIGVRTRKKNTKLAQLLNVLTGQASGTLRSFII